MATVILAESANIYTQSEHAHELINALPDEEYLEVVKPPQDLVDPVKMLQMVRDNRAVGVSINKLRINADIARALADLDFFKAISVLAAGFNVIDAEALEILDKAGKAVFTAKKYPVETVPDYVEKQLGVAMAGLYRGNALIEAGGWKHWCQSSFQIAPSDARVLVFGAGGAIGQKVIANLHAAGFGEIRGWGAKGDFAYRDGVEIPGSDGWVEEEDLIPALEVSNIILVHTAEVPATMGVLGAEELANCPRGTIFLNAARGTFLRENFNSLIPLLNNDGTAILDTLTQEPPNLVATNSLQELKEQHPGRLIVTPHQAWLTNPAGVKKIREQNLAAFVTVVTGEEHPDASRLDIGKYLGDRSK